MCVAVGLLHLLLEDLDSVMAGNRMGHRAGQPFLQQADQRDRQHVPLPETRGTWLLACFCRSNVDRGMRGLSQELPTTASSAARMQAGRATDQSMAWC